MMISVQKKNTEIMEFENTYFGKNTSVGLFERAAKAVCFPILKGAKPVSERRT